MIGARNRRKGPTNPIATGGNTALWHPWREHPGIRHLPVFWHDGSIMRNESILARPKGALDAIEFVGRNQLYVLCNDVLDEKEFSYSVNLVTHDKSEPYLSKHGRVVALRIHPTRKSGFFIPARTWASLPPARELCDLMSYCFKLFNLEAISPPSLSERALRVTLPDKLFIHRPPSDLRSVLLNHNGGGRIDEAEIWGEFFMEVFEYDLNKAYLYFSRLVPSPFVHAWLHYKPSADILDRHPTGFWHVSMIAHGSGIHPIYLGIQEGKKHKPREGEEFDAWLWTGTIKDCLEKGYTLLQIHRGYAWPEMSDFLSAWSDWLWDIYSQENDELVKGVLKSMMVGLPGRFLKEPMCYTLVRRGQEKLRKGDVPIAFNWIDKKGPFLSDWYVRPEFNRESTALTPIGAFIIEECRRAMYHRMRDEYARGNRVIRSYIDCYAVTDPSTFHVGNGRGEYKERIFENVFVESNRFIGIPSDSDLPEMRAPGLEGEARLALWRRYYER